jgi:hypothetical protein
MSTTSPLTSWRCGRERVRGGTQHLRQMREDDGELDDGWRRVEWRDARCQPHAAHIHVALCEPVAGHERVRRNLRLPAVPMFTTSGWPAPVQRISASLRASAPAAFTFRPP